MLKEWTDWRKIKINWIQFKITNKRCLDSDQRTLRKQKLNQTINNDPVYNKITAGLTGIFATKTINWRDGT